MRLNPAVLCAALLIPCVPAHARDDEQTQEEGAKDVVVLSSGNRLEGEIVGLYRGELSFSIDGAGAVDIDWKNVETLTSMRTLDVELASGRRLSGPIESPSPGRIAVASGTAAAAAVGKEEVVRIAPTRAPGQALSGHIDLGAEFLSANDERGLTLDAELEKRTRNYLTSLMLDSVFSEIEDETQQRRNYLQLVSRRFLSDRWFAAGRVDLEEDLALDLDSRALLGLGGGRTLIQSNRTVLELYGGLDVARERLREVPGTDSSTEAFASLGWHWFEIGGNTELSTNATAFFGLDRSRRRVELALSLRRNFIGRMHWSVNLYESYDSDAPPDVDNSDNALTFALGRSF